MSAADGRQLPEPPTSLFDHALRLHRHAPDRPLPGDGYPFPDDGRHRGRPRPHPPKDRRTSGVAVARVLGEFFARPDAPPSALAEAFHDVYVPAQPNDDIAAAALAADAERVRQTGRWLVRHGTDRCAVTVGLALLAARGTARDIPLIQTIGLLSDRYGPLAARALERLPGGTEALVWLADRVTHWGRVYVVEALCRREDPAARPWLLRRACDGDLLNAYFVGKVAYAAALHEAMAEADVEDEVVDQAGTVLLVMTFSQGMGTTLAHYAHAEAVLGAHLAQLARLGPTPARFCAAARLASSLGERGDAGSIGPAGRWRPYRRRYLALLDREDWCAVARSALAAGDRDVVNLAGTPAGRSLRASRRVGTGARPRDR